jgi:hypothetical protein
MERPTQDEFANALREAVTVLEVIKAHYPETLDKIGKIAWDMLEKSQNVRNREVDWQSLRY